MPVTNTLQILHKCLDKDDSFHDFQEQFYADVDKERRSLVEDFDLKYIDEDKHTFCGIPIDSIILDDTTAMVLLGSLAAGLAAPVKVLFKYYTMLNQEDENMSALRLCGHDDFFTQLSFFRHVCFDIPQYPDLWFSYEIGYYGNADDHVYDWDTDEVHQMRSIIANCIEIKFQFDMVELPVPTVSFRITGITDLDDDPSADLVLGCVCRADSDYIDWHKHY